LISDRDWKLLVGHAEKLRVLEMGTSEFFTKTARPWLAEAGDIETIRSVYRRQYSTHRDPASSIEEEGVSHMLELLQHGALKGSDIEPIRAVLDKVFNGRLETAIPAANENAPAMFAFAGERAKTANLQRLEQAQGMERAGVDYFEIRKATGWERGADGNWKFEVSDKDAQLKGRAAKIASGQFETRTVAGRADEIIDNPLVFEAYPELMKFRVEVHHHKGKPASGSIDQDARLIKVTAPSAAQAIQKIAHELQHAIQRKEGWAEGGSPVVIAGMVRRAKADVDAAAGGILDRVAALEAAGDDASVGSLVRQLSDLKAQRDELNALDWVTLYKRLAGEVEARNVEARIGFQRAERIGISMRFTEDVARPEQIIFAGARRQLSDEWEADYWAELANQSHGIEQAIANRGGPARPLRDVPASEIERAAADLGKKVAALELKLWKAGNSTAEIAAAIKAQFGFDVDAETIARGQVWWRIDQLVSSRRAVQWTPEGLAEIGRLYKEGKSISEIATHMSTVLGRPVSTYAIDGQLRRVVSRTRVAKVDDVWNDTLNLELERLYTQSRADFPSYLRDLMAEKKHSQRTLSRASGVSEPKISQILAGQINAGPVTLRRLTDALGVDAPKQFDRVDPDLGVIATALSKLAGRKITPSQIRTQVVRLKISKQAGRESASGQPRVWTSEMLDVLTSEDIEGLSYNQIALMLSTRFDTDITRNAVSGIMHRVKAEKMRAAFRERAADLDMADRTKHLGDVVEACKK